MAGGGHMGVLWMPFEFMIILGAGIGAYIVAKVRTIDSKIAPIRYFESRIEVFQIGLYSSLQFHTKSNSKQTTLANAVVLACFNAYAQGSPLGAIQLTQSMLAHSGPIGITPL